MTFGEHLEELRHCLVRGIICLGIGLAFGLLFANHVIRFISTPLKEAIAEYQAEQDLYSLGYTDEKDADRIKLKSFLQEQSVSWQVVYEVPEKYQTLTAEDVVESKDDEQPVVASTPLAEMLTSLPDPSDLKPRLQLLRTEQSLSSFKIEEPFLIWIKAGLIVGAVFASPFMFYYLWTFVAAGLLSLIHI